MAGRFITAALWTIASFLLVGSAIEAVARSGWVDTHLVPPPTEVVATLLALLRTADAWTAIGNTLLGWAIGMALAIAGGLAVGVAMGSSAWLRELTHAPFEFLRPVPPIVLLPLVTLLLGPTLAMKVTLIFIGAFWPIVYQASYGVREVDPVLRDTAKVFDIGHWKRTAHIVVPSALPMVMTGVRVAAGIGFVVAIVSELVGGAPGIGNQMIALQGSGAYRELYAYIVIAGILGLAVNGVMGFLEARLLHWHPSQRLGLAP